MTSNPHSSPLGATEPLRVTRGGLPLIHAVGGPRACSRCMFGLHHKCQRRVAYPGQPERDCSCCGGKSL